MSSKSVTIAEIAAEAGVSVPTVSRVLNGRKGVSPDTRQVIEGLLAERGYERRGRPDRSTGLIDFVISSLETQWAVALLRGAQAEASRQGADLVVTTTDGAPFGTPGWVEHLTRRGTDGVVLVVSELLPAGQEKLERLRVPVVLVDPVGSGTQPFATVAATDWAGGRDATDHLLALGHRRIGFITGPIQQVCHRDRLDGYQAALRRNGIRIDPDLVRNGDSLGGGWAPSCWPCRIRRPRSSPARTSRPTACTRQPTTAGCGSPRTSPWSATTTSSCASGSPRS